jgi:hypothetical protein
VDWIHLTPGKVKWLDIVKRAINLFSVKEEQFRDNGSYYQVLKNDSCVVYSVSQSVIQLDRQILLDVSSKYSVSKIRWRVK